MHLVGFYYKEILKLLAHLICLTCNSAPACGVVCSLSYWISGTSVGNGSVLYT